MGDQPDARPIPAQNNTNKEKCGHTSMPWVGFKPTIPVFEQPKTVCASDHMAIGTILNYILSMDLKCDLFQQCIIVPETDSYSCRDSLLLITFSELESLDFQETSVHLIAPILSPTWKDLYIVYNKITSYYFATNIHSVL